MTELFNINANNRKQVENKSFYMDCDFSLEDAASVINVEAKAYITSQETLADEIRVCGNVCFTAIYLDSENSFRSEEIIKNYEETLLAQDITPLDFSIINLSVMDTDYIGVGVVKARATLEFAGSYLVKREIGLINQAEEGILVKKEVRDFQNVIAMPECLVEFNDSMDIDEDCNRILSYNTKAIVTKTMQGEEVITIEGEAITQVIYVAEGTIKSQEYVNSFTGEILSEDIKLDTKVHAMAQVKSDAAKMVDSKRGKECEIAFAIKISCFAICNASMEVVTDAYSIDNDCTLSSKKYLVDNYENTRYFKEQFVTTVEISDDTPPIKSVMTILSPAIGAISISASDKSVVEGIVSCTTLYLDVNDKIEKIDSEVPYQFKLLDDYKKCNIDNIYAQIASINCKLKHSKVVELNIEMSIAVSASAPSTKSLLTGIDLLGQKEKDDYAITCVIAKPGDDIWSISKTLSVKESDLLDINKHIELPLKAGEKIIYYRGME